MVPKQGTKGQGVLLSCSGQLKTNGKPVGCGSIFGAIGGPCNGHLSLSQVRLVEPLVVEQMNSSPCIEQTWAPSPKQKILSVEWTRLQKMSFFDRRYHAP